MMNERNLADRRLKNTSSARKLLLEYEELYHEMKATESDAARMRHKAAAYCLSWLSATTLVAEQSDNQLVWQIPGYTLASYYFVETAVAHFFKSASLRQASESARNAYEFNNLDFVGLPTPQWIQADPAYDKFKSDAET